MEDSTIFIRYGQNYLAIAAIVCGFCLAAAGCTRATLDPPAEAAIPVTVSYPVQREITDYADFTARTAAVDSVEVRSRVWGYLKKVNFKEGALVKKDEVLFELDERPYQAEYARCLALLNSAQAHLNRSLADLQRGRAAAEEGDRAVRLRPGQRQLRRGGCGRESGGGDAEDRGAQPGFYQDHGARQRRASRYMVTVGNLVQSADQANVTLLTTIVSVDPMYACFDVDERTVLRVRQMIREGKARSARDFALPVQLGLANEEGFPHAGTIDFVDNQVNPKTGTQRLRGTFPNKDDVLMPGFFARVRIPIGKPRQALLVTDRAIDNDQGQKIVYVVNDKREVVARAIRAGLLHDGLREIGDGLQSGDRVIVNGLQTVRPGMVVDPQVVEMPRSGPKSEARPAPVQISQSH